jgi:hypothetical protein
VRSPRPICLRFGVNRPRPPGHAESIGTRASTTSATRNVTTGPTSDTRCTGTKCHVSSRPGYWSGASLEVCVPCNARWSHSRCPGRPASGRSRFGVSIPVGPRVLSSERTCRRDGLAVALAVFRWSGFLCDEARVAGRVLVRAFQSNPPRVARVCFGALPQKPLCGATARRSVVLTRTPSITRAGETGETDPSGVIRPAHRPPDLTRRRHAREQPVHSSAFAKPPPPDTGHAPSRLLSRGVPLPIPSYARPGRATQVLPSGLSVARRRSWGSFPSQVCSRKRVDASRLLGTR